jgi:hypothetical protein
MCSTASPIITQKPNCGSSEERKKAALRARDSDRRASDFVQIPITLTDSRGESTSNGGSTWGGARFVELESDIRRIAE